MRILTVLLLSAAIAACNTKKKDAGAVENKPAASEQGSKIVRNNIDFNATGVTVNQAFLTYEDGSLVADNNKMNIGQRVVLHLMVEGWKVNAEGKVLLGAAEKISTSEGQVILNKDDLFDSYQSGVSEADSRIITLSATITASDKQFKYFEVAFRVWDKGSGDNITGTYKLYPRT